MKTNTRKGLMTVMFTVAMLFAFGIFASVTASASNAVEPVMTVKHGTKGIAGVTVEIRCSDTSCSQSTALVGSAKTDATGTATFADLQTEIANHSSCNSNSPTFSGKISEGIELYDAILTAVTNKTSSNLKAMTAESPAAITLTPKDCKPKFIVKSAVGEDLLNNINVEIYCTDVNCGVSEHTAKMKIGTAATTAGSDDAAGAATYGTGIETHIYSESFTINAAVKSDALIGYKTIEIEGVTYKELFDSLTAKKEYVIKMEREVYTIKGTVKSAAAQNRYHASEATAIPNAKVQLTYTGAITSPADGKTAIKAGDKVAVVYADDKGAFEFTGLFANIDYTLTVGAAEFANKSTAVKIAASTGLAGVTADTNSGPEGAADPTLYHAEVELTALTPIAGVIAYSDDESVYFDLGTETFKYGAPTVNFTATAITTDANFLNKIVTYSIDGGSKWKKVGKNGMDDKTIGKLLNKDATIAVANTDIDKVNKTKKPEVNATSWVVTFDSTKKRPKVPKAMVNYVILASTDGNTSGAWTFASVKNATAKGDNNVNLVEGLEIAQPLKPDDKKNPGAFTAFDSENGQEVVKWTDKAPKGTKDLYFYRLAATSIMPDDPTDTTGATKLTTGAPILTPASKMKKVNILGELPAPKYKYNEKKLIIKYKKNTYVQKDSTILFDGKPTTAGGTVGGKAEDAGTYVFWTAAGKKPASAKTEGMKVAAPATPAS